MDKDKTLKRLAKDVKRGKFSWEKYVMGGTWHGLEIQSQALFCSYGQIGYTVTVTVTVTVNGSTAQRRSDTIGRWMKRR